MKKGKYYIIVNILAFILVVLFFDQSRIENKEENSVFMNSILKSYKMELSLHRNLIGCKYSDLDSIIVNESKSKSNAKFKVVCLLLDSTDNEFDYEKTLITVLDYYAELKSSSNDFRDTELFLIQKYTFFNLEEYVQINYENEIIVLNDSTNYFAKYFNFPQRGAVVMLLNSENVCQYAYYLERSNERKVFENSKVILNLLKNRHE